MRHLSLASSFLLAWIELDCLFMRFLSSFKGFPRCLPGSIVFELVFMSYLDSSRVDEFLLGFTQFID